MLLSNDTPQSYDWGVFLCFYVNCWGRAKIELEISPFRQCPKGGITHFKKDNAWVKIALAASSLDSRGRG